VLTDEPPEEELRLGSTTERRVRLPRLPTRARLGLVVLLAAAVATPLIVNSSNGGRPSAAPAATNSTSAVPNPPITRPPSTVLIRTPITRPPVVRHTQPFLLGIHQPWELFARGDRSVVRIQFGRGRVTTTDVPPLASSGGVSFVVGNGSALVRPYDYVPGYVIPDGRRTGQPAAAFDCGGPAFPGPRPGTVWIAPCRGETHRMLLTRLDGARTGVSIKIPPGLSPLDAMPDGRGYLLFLGSDTITASPATFDVRPGRTTVVTRDTVLAAGPTRWLIEHCRHSQCTATVVNRTTSARRRLPTVVPPAESLGTISPDGRTAAFINAFTPPAAIEILDLRTGAVRMVPIRPDFVDIPVMVWSPDSRWLFLLDRHGSLYAVLDPAGQAMEMSELTPLLRLPPLRQLAIRPVPTSAARH
jgi:hypothetical protein